MKWKFIYLKHFDEWLWLEIEGMNIVWLYIIHITSRRFFWYLSIRYIFKYLQFQIWMCKKVIQKNCICLSNWLNDKDIKLLERFFFLLWWRLGMNLRSCVMNKEIDRNRAGNSFWFCSLHCDTFIGKFQSKISYIFDSIGGLKKSLLLHFG